jgi:hypothetical protein
MLQLIILGYELTYFDKHETKGKQCNREYDVFSMFQQIIGTPMGTNCAHFLVDISLYSNEAELILKLIRLKKYKACNLTIRYIGDVLSINNTNCANYIPLM